MFLKVSWLYFFLGITLHVQAQERLYMHLNARSGLPGNKVYSVSQDGKGFIWMATDRGALRWNGHEFRKYGVDEGLPDNEVMHVFDDAQGRIWTMCFNTMPGCLEQGEAQRTAVEALLGGFKPCDVFSHAYFNHKREYWLSFRNDSGVFLITRPGSRERYRMHMPLQMESINLIDVVKYGDGSVDFYLPGKLLHLRKGGQKPETYSLKFPGSSNLPVFHKRLNFYHEGHYFALTNDAFLLEYSFANHRPVLHQFVRLPLDARNYFFRNNRPYVYDEKGQVYDISRAQFDTGYSFLKDKQVNELFYDRQGNLWVSTLNNGVYLYPAQSLLLAVPGEIKDAITHVRFGNYHVFGTEYNGLYVLDTRFKVVRHHPELRRPVKLLVAGKHCVVASDQGLYYMNASLQLHPFGGIRILKDVEYFRGDTFYAANYRNAFRVVLNSERADTIYRGRTTAIWGDAEGTVWVGTMQGLIKIAHGRQEQVQAHTLLHESRISDITGDNRGRLFVATHNNGLFVLQGSEILHFTNRNWDPLTSLPDRQLIGLLSDGSKLWVLGAAGLSVIAFGEHGIRPQEHRFLGPMNGLPAGIFYGINNSEENGIPEVLTDLGLVRISNVQNLPNPELFAEIEGISRQGKPLPAWRWQDLGNEENELTIHYNSVAVLTEPGLTYEYRISALDSQWVVTKANQVHFSDLKPGAYVFEVRARAGSLVSKPVQVSFYIRPAWYQYPLTQISLALVSMLALLLLVISVMRKSARKMQLANQESQKLAELELQALRSRMNPHFVFNVLTAIQNFITQGREEEANYYTSQFAHLIRQTFHGSTFHFISLAEEVQLLNNYLDLERMRFRDRLDYTIEVDSHLDLEEYIIPSMLVQPFLENAINHGMRPLRNRKGMLLVRLKKHGDERLFIEVEDNGVGIKAAQQQKELQTRVKHHKSEGMELARNRIDLMNKCYRLDMHLEVRDLSEQGSQGTLVLIDLPLRITGDKFTNALKQL